MRTASRPALRALPIATVATGTPAGICTIDSSESRPSSWSSGTGTPITGQRGHRRGHAREMRGAAGAGDDHAQTPIGGRARAYSNIASGVRCADTIRAS